MRAIFLKKRDKNKTRMDLHDNKDKEEETRLMDKLKADLNEIKMLNANIAILKSQMNKFKIETANQNPIEDDSGTISTVINLER